MELELNKCSQLISAVPANHLQAFQEMKNIQENVQHQTAKIKSMIKKQNKKAKRGNLPELSGLIIEYNDQISGIYSKIKKTMSFESLSKSATSEMKNEIENCQLQDVLRDKIDAITLRKLFVSSEFTRRAAKLNDFLENSLKITLIENIQELPKLECQLKKSNSENIMTMKSQELNFKVSSSFTSACLNTGVNIQSKSSLTSERIKEIHKTLQLETGKIKSIIKKQRDENTICEKGSDFKDFQAGFDESLDLIELTLNEEITSLILDLVFVTFEYMRIAKCILQPDMHQSFSCAFIQHSLGTSFLRNNAGIKAGQELKINTPKKEDAIRFSLGKASINSAQRFNKNIFSVNIKNILENKGHRLKFEEDLKCQKCSAFYCSYSETKESDIFYFGKTKTSEQYWNCCICGNKNISKKIFNINNYDDVEYELAPSPKPVTTKKLNSKIIVFCIDVSGSMAGKNIETVKSSCLATLKLIKEKNSEFKVALVTFQSSGVYYGHGNLCEPTIDGSLLNSVNNQNSVKNQGHSLKPITESYDQIVNQIQRIAAGGGTNIISALVHSVLLASSFENSEIILCTDGAAQDMCEKTYKEIAKYCNQNGNIQINLVTFDECEVDLNHLGLIVSETNGIIKKTCDPFEFESTMKIVIEQSSKKVLTDSISIIGDYDRVKFIQSGQSLNSHQIHLNNWNPAIEILLEFRVENKQNINRDEKYLFFQVKIEKNDLIRVITKRIEIAKEQNTKEAICDLNLINAYSLRKLTQYIYEENDYKEAANYLSDYKEILENYEDIDIRITKTIDIISSLNDFNSISDKDAEVLHNNKRVNSFDLKQDVKARGMSVLEIKEMISQCREIKDTFRNSCNRFNEITDQMSDNNDKEKSDFKKEIMAKFEDFDQQFMQSDVSEIVMYAVVELINQMNLLMKKIKDIMNINEHGSYVNDKKESFNKVEDDYFSGEEDEGDYDEKIENLKKNVLVEIHEIEKFFEKFNKLKAYSESWISKDQSLIETLFENIVSQCKQQKQPIVELSDKMVKIIDKSESIIG